MVSLYDIIQRLHPDAEPEMSVEVRGGKITRWGLADPRPTRADLDAARLPALRESKRQEMRRAAFSEMDTHLIDGYPERDLIFIILDKAQGVNDPRLSALADIRERLADKTAYIDDPARTEAELEAVSW